MCGGGDGGESGWSGVERSPEIVEIAGEKRARV
jgi:hypothetical protein